MALLALAVVRSSEKGPVLSAPASQAFSAERQTEQGWLGKLGQESKPFSTVVFFTPSLSTGPLSLLRHTDHTRPELLLHGRLSSLLASGELGLLLDSRQHLI